MAFIECNMRSSGMEIETSVWVTLPQNRVQGILYLLHDNGKNHTYFNRNISLESLCDKYQVAAVVPDMNVSCCLDLCYGDAYYTFLRDELPDMMEQYFGISRQERTRVAGVGTGGYGAFHLACDEKSNVTSAASISGIMDIRNYLQRQETMKIRRNYEAALIGNKNREEWDLVSLVENNSGLMNKKLIQYVREDELIDENRTFYEYIKTLGIYAELVTCSVKQKDQYIESVLEEFLQK